MNNIVNEVAQIISNLSRKKNNLIIAIDGRCASGKTTLAAELRKIYECNVLHMDEFFLRPEQRTEERLGMPGENIDHERFLEEVLLPLKAGRDFSYRPYNCKTGELDEPIMIYAKKINIVEGSYSCHNDLCEYYDLRVFITVDEDEQLRRIAMRNGEEAVKIFEEKWIPLEEKYFETFGIKERCELILDNGEY